jgi:hypothetical protein
MLPQIKIDGEWKLEDLPAFVDPVEIYDADDKLIGLFVPADLERGKRIHAEVAAKLDPAELARRSQEKGGRPLAESIARLKRLEADALGNGSASRPQEPTACPTL